MYLSLHCTHMSPKLPRGGVVVTRGLVCIVRGGDRVVLRCSSAITAYSVVYISLYMFIYIHTYIRYQHHHNYPNSMHKQVPLQSPYTINTTKTTPTPTRCMLTRCIKPRDNTAMGSLCHALISICQSRPPCHVTVFPRVAAGLFRFGSGAADSPARVGPGTWSVIARKHCKHYTSTLGVGLNRASIIRGMGSRLCSKIHNHESNPASYHSQSRVTAHEHQREEFVPVQSKDHLVDQRAVHYQRDSHGDIQQG